MFARFDENPAMTPENIKETKRYGRTDGWTHGRTLLQLDTSWVLTVLEKVAKKA